MPKNEDNTLVLAFEAKLDKMQKGIDAGLKVVVGKLDKAEAAAKKSAAKIDSAFSAMAGSVANRFKVLSNSLAGFFTLQGLKTIADRVETAVDHFDDLADTSAKLGTTAGALVQWQAALQLAGGEMEEFNGAAAEFQGKVGAVIGNIGKTKATKSALAALGISTADMAAAKDLQSRLLLIAEAISKVGDKAVQAAIADKLGIRPLLPLLAQGKVGVEELTAKFVGLRDAADDGAEKTGDMADKLKLVKAELQMKEDSFFVKTAPAMIRFYNLLSDIFDLMGKNQVFFSLLGGQGFQAGIGIAANLVTPEKILAQMKVNLTKLKASMVSGKEMIPVPAGASPAQFLGSAPVDGRAAAAAQERDLRLSIAALEVQIQGNKNVAKTKEAIAAANRHITDTGGTPLTTAFDEEGDAAAKEAESLQKLVEARRNWRNDPSALGEMIRKGNEASGRVDDDLLGDKSPVGEKAYNAAHDAAQAHEDLKNGIKSDLREAFSQGDYVQVLERRVEDGLWKAFDKSLDKLADQLATIFENIGGSGGDFFARLLGGGGNTPSSSNGWGSGISWLTHRAAGGPVMAGSPYWTGEHGPEPFIPAVKGRILSVPQAQAALRGGGGSGGGTTVYIDARGATKDAIPGIQAAIAGLQKHAQGEPYRVRGYVNEGIKRRQVAA